LQFLLPLAGQQVRVCDRPQVIDEGHEVQEQQAGQPRLVEGRVEEVAPVEEQDEAQSAQNRQRRNGDDRPSTGLAGGGLAQPGEQRRQQGRSEGRSKRRRELHAVGLPLAFLAACPSTS
jgi:hypothetical protein